MPEKRIKKINPPEDRTFETPVLPEEWEIARRIFEANPNAVKIKCYKDTQQRNNDLETFPISLAANTPAKTRIIVNTYDAERKLTGSEIRGLPEEIGDPNIYSALHHSFIKWLNSNNIFALDTEYLSVVPPTTIKLAQDEDGDLYVLKIMNYQTASGQRYIQRADTEAWASFFAGIQHVRKYSTSRYYSTHPVTPIVEEGISRYRLEAASSEATKAIVIYPHLGYDLVDMHQADLLVLNARILIALQMIQILCNLHKQRIVHCDIKPDNFVVDPKTGRVSLIDFGYALPYLQNKNYASHATAVGTRGYFAPEIRDRRSNLNLKYDWETDIYSLGQCILALFPTYPNNSVDRAYWNTLKQLITLSEYMCLSQPNFRPCPNDMQILLHHLPADVKAELEYIQNQPSYNALRRRERAQATQEMTESARTTPETRDDDTPYQKLDSPVEEETKHCSLSTHRNSFLQNQNKDDALSPAGIDKAPNDPCPSLK